MTLLRRSIICLALLITSPALLAAVFTVNSTALDAPDFNPGNGVCDSSFIIGFQCTLRAAIMEANALPGPDLIVFSMPGQTVTLTIPAEGMDDAASGDLNITESVSISGFANLPSDVPDLRPTLVADNNGRIFRIEDDNVSLIGLRLTGGEADNGGAILVDHSEGVILDGIEIFDNESTSSGGGIYMGGSTVEMSRMDIRNNQSNDWGAAIMLTSSSEAIVSYSSIRANLDSSPFEAAALNSVAGSSLTLLNTTISQNTGSGIRTNSTLSARNVSIVENSDEGILFFTNNNTLFLRNVVVSGGCTVSGETEASISTNGHNLANSDGCEIELGSSNIIAGSSGLGPLQRQADEFSAYHIPQPGSPLIDNGHPVIGGIGCIAEDQLGTSRPIDGDDSGSARCDIGSIEAPEPPPPADDIFSDRFELNFVVIP